MDHMPPMHVRDWHAADRAFRQPADHHTRAYAADRAVRRWYAAEARCACGCTEEHPVAHRLTADGYRFEVSSRGGVYRTTLADGRGDRPVAAYRRAVFEVLRVVECLTHEEAVAAVREARKRHLVEMKAAEVGVWREAYEAKPAA